MKGKILLLTGLAVGYVLGTKAGRERYEEIKSTANKLWNDPRVQKPVKDAETFVKDKAQQAQDFVNDKAPEVAEFVSDNVKKVVNQVSPNRATTKKATTPPSSSTTE
jgi:histidinol dehydrogenase